MKLSTLNQANPSPIVANEKRMDVFLKQQMVEHQAVIAAHNKEIQAMRDSLALAMQKFDSSFTHAQEQNKKDIDKLELNVFYLNNQIKSLNVLINDQKKTITDLYQEMHGYTATYATKVDVDNHKKEINSHLDIFTKNQLSAYEDFQSDLKFFFIAIKEEFLKHKKDIEKKLLDTTNLNESKISQSKIDGEAILKQIRIYEKSMFIIEKKIEHIYIQIKRINNKGSLCHKPE